MDFITVFVKILIILLLAFLPSVPLVFEYMSFRKDKENGISHRRLRMVVFSVIYVIAVTVFFLIQQQFLNWVSSLAFVQWLVSKLAVSDRLIYGSRVFAAIAINFIIGLVYRFVQHFLHIGLKKKKLSAPSGKDGQFSFFQKIKRRILFYFNKEFFFFVGRILKGIAFGLTITYTVLVILFQIPALFSAEWIPYNVLATVFDAGNIYYILTLLVLWQMAFFLEGVSLLEKECPELLNKEKDITPDEDIDLDSIDRECKREYRNFFAGDFTAINNEKADTENGKTANKAASEDNGIDSPVSDNDIISYSIVKAIENDKRITSHNVELYRKCIDMLIRQNNTSFIVNGNFLGSFSVYFFRYLSMIAARGDNIAIICNSNDETDTVYKFVTDAFSKIGSLYTQNSRKKIDFDNPVWKIHKITKEEDLRQRTQMQDASVIITTLSYLCSKEFEYFSGSFIQLLDTVVFVSALDTVNLYSDQLSAMNQRFANIIENNSRKSKSNDDNPGFRIRYKSLPIRYIAFDDSRIPGLDKALKNLLSVNFESTDTMISNGKAIVRFYNNESVPEDGVCIFPNILNTSEMLGTVFNMAVVAAKAGAKKIYIYENGSVPYRNYQESLDANLGRIQELYGDVSILINKYSYADDSKPVVIVFDEKCNLPEILRRYLSLFGNNEVLLMIFSKQYLFRDYYVDNIEKLCIGCQYSRIPFYEGTFRDIARRILLKADSGGITAKHILYLCSSLPQFKDDISKNDINAILVKVLKEFGICQDDYVNIYEYFEYSYSKEFDENGKFDTVDKIKFRYTGQYYDIVNGLDCVKLSVNSNIYNLPINNQRISQRYIEGQNIIYEGNIYKIDMILSDQNEIKARLASGGYNNEAVDYIQDREYIAYLSDEDVTIERSSHIIITHNNDIDNTDSIHIDSIYLDVIAFPMEVVTKGYYIIDANSMTLNFDNIKYVSIFEGINERICKQTYRKYGYIESPFYSLDDIITEGEINASDRQAHALLIKLKGNFGEKTDRTASLAGVMLNEILKMIFPSVAECIAVCPVYHDPENITAEGRGVLDFYPKLTIKGDRDKNEDEIELLIIEDCSYDIGLLYTLTESGDDVLNTLFTPVRDYLQWLKDSVDGSRYLYFGKETIPQCFDIDSLLALSKVITESKNMVDTGYMKQIEEKETCDFCRRKVPKSIHDIVEGKDGRVMCSRCRKSIVGNDKKKLTHLVEKAKLFIESTYNVNVEPEKDIYFEPTDVMISLIKNGRDKYNRGNDLPLMSFIDENNDISIEYDIPELNIQELIIRELIQYWQISEIPDVDDELAEGQIAFVTIQFLSFIGNKTLYRSLLSYYESTRNASGIGYRKLIKSLVTYKKYRGNPFYMLMSYDEEDIKIPKRIIAGEGDYGRPYTPEVHDRCTTSELHHYYYEHITSKMKELYDVLYEAVKNYKTEVVFNGVEIDDILNAMTALKGDHPELFWLNRITRFSSVGDKHTAFIDYGANKEETEMLKKRIDEAVKPFLEGITPEMSAYDALIRLHVKMINHIDYDTIGLNYQDKTGGPKDGEIDSLRSITGTLLDGKAVCAGYARTMQYLANLCGIECAYCRGYCYGDGNSKGEYHAWNLVRLDGEYYYLDTTWCDQSDTVQTVRDTDISFRYFCITSEELSRSRSIDKQPVQFPEYKNTKCNYYIHNGLFIEKYDLTEIIEMAEHSYKDGKKYLEFKCASNEVFNETMDKLFRRENDVWEITEAVRASDKSADKSIKSSCTYSYDNKMLTVRICFRTND